MAFLTPPPPPPLSLGAFPSPAPRPNAPPSLPTRRRRNLSPALALPNPFADPNRKTFLGRVHVIERQKLPFSVVEDAFGPLTKRDVSRLQIDAAIESCNAWFTANGYPCSRLLVISYPSIFNRTLALYSVEPRLAGIRLLPVDRNGAPVEGATVTTRTDLVLRVLGMRIGEVFSWTPDGFGSLMALGIFEFADAEVNVVTNERVELTLKIKERPTCRVEPGAGITSDGRVYGDISFVDNNLMGRAQRVRLEWQKRLDSARAAGCFAFEDMRIGSSIPVSVRFRAYRDANSSRGVPSARLGRLRGGPHPPGTDVDTDTTQRDIETPQRFEKDRDGAMFELGYRPGKSNVLLTFSPIVEAVQPNPSERATRSTAILQTVLQTAATHITRLPIDCPRFGHIIRVENSFGRTLSDGGMVFRKTLVRLAQYFSVGPYASVAVGANFGFGSESLPWHEQRSLGGHSNVRGYEYGELGRYKSFGTGRFELRVPLTRAPPVDEKASAAREDSTQDESKGSENVEKDKKEASDRSDGDRDGRIRNSGNLMSPKMIPSLPPLVGVLFGDVALSNEEGGEPIGTSYGLGVRVGGVITVDWTRTMDGRKSRLHFGLVDRNL